MAVDYDLLRRCVIAVDILLCAAIILCNLFLLFSILLCRHARRSTRNAMLVSMCVADLLVGGFTQPIHIHSYRTHTLYHSCEVHIFLQLVADYCQDFVCFWTLVTIGTVYVYQVAAGRLGWGSSIQGHYQRLSAPVTKCHTVLRGAMKALLVGWPWLGALLIPIPILLATVDENIREHAWTETFCPLHASFPFRMVVLVLVFYLPIVVLCVLCVGLALLILCDWHRAKKRRQRAAIVATETVTQDTANGHPAGNPVYRGGGSPPEEGFQPGYEDAGQADRAAESDHCTNEASTPSGTAGCTIHTQGISPSCVQLNGERGRDIRGDPDSLDRPVKVLIPLVVTVTCVLPSMVAWLFYRLMYREDLIIISITLSRVYLLRAALLPVSWFAMAELRHAAAALLDRLNGRKVSCSRAGRETGEFSVAYTTLRETRDAPGTCDGQEGREVRRQNPFDPNFVPV